MVFKADRGILFARKMMYDCALDDLCECPDDWYVCVYVAVR